MQFCFDGGIGFLGGFVDDFEDFEIVINREVVEELGKIINFVNIVQENYVIFYLYEEYVLELDIIKRFCLYFFIKKVFLEQFLEFERRRLDVLNFGYEVIIDFVY